MEIRKMSPSELDKAIKEELERVGSYEAWRRKGSADEVPPEPQKPRTLSKSEQYLDDCTWVAEYRGISIEELFKREPKHYKRYRQLVLDEQFSGKSLPEGPSITHRRCPRVQLTRGGQSGACSFVDQPCKTYRAKTSLPRFTRLSIEKVLPKASCQPLFKPESN
jgi:hypothetical protein